MTCRRCGHELSLSLVGVPRCTECARREHGQIDQLVHDGKLIADRAHVVLLESAADEESLKPA